MSVEFTGLRCAWRIRPSLLDTPCDRFCCHLCRTKRQSRLPQWPNSLHGFHFPPEDECRAKVLV